MGMYSWDFGSVCGSTNLTVTCTYVPATNKINVYGCFGQISLVNTYGGVTNTHRVDIIPNNRIDGDGTLAEYLTSMGTYGIASRATTLTPADPADTFISWTVQGSLTPEQYEERVLGQSNWKLTYVDYVYPSPWTGGGVASITLVTSGVPTKPNTPTFTIRGGCDGTQTVPKIYITSNDTDVQSWHIQRSTTSGGTYSTITTLYSSASTRSYTDTGATGAEYWYRVTANNQPWEEESDIAQYLYATQAPDIPTLVGDVITADYPILSFTAETTNMCVDYDEVVWFLDGDYLDTTTGNTISDVVPAQGVVYDLTARYVKDNVTGDTSTAIQLYYVVPVYSGFTNSGTLVIPENVASIDYLIIGGGGGGAGGARRAGGGGGGGEFFTGSTALPVAGNYTVTIGAGGAGGEYGVSHSANGGTSSLVGTSINENAIGGGGGRQYSPNVYCPGTFASGGGGYNPLTNGYTLGCTGTETNGGRGIDYNDGVNDWGSGGGGGGAAGGGSNGTSNNGGAAGAGYASSFDGTGTTVYCSGGTGGRSITYPSVNPAPSGTTYGSGGDGIGAWTGAYDGGDGAGGVVYTVMYLIQEGAPDKPTGETASSITCTGATLTWVNNATGDTEGNSIKQYSGGTWVEIATVSSGTTGYTITGLTPLVEYQFIVCAYNDTYEVCSDAVFIQTLDPAPFNLLATSGVGNAVINWQINDPPFGTGIRPELRLSGDTVWTSGDTIAHSAVTHQFTGLTFLTDYQCRFVRLGSEYPSNILDFSTTDLPVPTGLTNHGSYINKIVVTWVNNYAYDDMWAVINGNEINIVTGSTGYTFTGLSPSVTYQIYIKVEIDGNQSISNAIYVQTASIPLPFCEYGSYTVTGNTCGNADGVVEITNKLYMELYNFALLDFSGNSQSFGTNYAAPDYGMITGLTSDWYRLQSVVKPEYKNYLSNDTCVSDWFGIEDTDSTVSVYNFRHQPAQCGPFDIQKGRFTWSISGSSATYNAYFYDADAISVYNTQTGISGTTLSLGNLAGGCYFGKLVSIDDGCTALIDKNCVQTDTIATIGGIKRLFVTNFNTDLEYDYWKSSDEGYFVESEDTSSFLSTKIKRYYSHSGGTLTWYGIPVHSDMELTQNLAKTRQGFVLTDVLNVSVPKTAISRFAEFTTLLPNKWVYVLEDGNGNWWTGGFAVGATIENYVQETSERGSADNRYTFGFKAVSSDKLLTSLDEDWVQNNILT